MHISSDNCMIIKKKMEIKTHMQLLQPELISNKIGHINIAMLEAALFYAQNLLNETIGVESGPANKNRHNYDEYFKKNCYLPEYKLPN